MEYNFRDIEQRWQKKISDLTKLLPLLLLPLFSLLFFKVPFVMFDNAYFDWRRSKLKTASRRCHL